MDSERDAQSAKCLLPHLETFESAAAIFPAATRTIEPETANDDSIRFKGRTHLVPARHFVFGNFLLVPTRRLLIKDGNAVTIGNRALDLLIALVDRAGEIISKSDLISKVWPHTFVEVDNLRVHIAELRRVLGDGLSDNRYISTVTGRGYCFVAPVAHADNVAQAPAKASRARPQTNVPLPLSRMIGIADSVESISAKLADHRLVTLVGPGGVGKTSAATAVAAGAGDRYRHGVWFVDLAAVRDQLELPMAIAAAVRADFHAHDAPAGLLSLLSDKEMLLVFDNCEHVVESAANLAFEILQSARDVRILATSREPLLVDGEQVYSIRPLAVPSMGSALSAPEALEFPAVELFVEHASNVSREFQLRGGNVTSVIDICQKLDGLPLAIEFAAGSIDTLGLPGVLSRLDHPLRLPPIRRRRAAPRHRTLRGTLEWSYRLLTQEEQRVFCRLSVFNGSFTVEAAAAAVADPAGSKSDTEDRIISLVSKSLVAKEQNGCSTRLRLLSIARAYATEQLAESSKTIAIQAPH